MDTTMYKIVGSRSKEVLMKRMQKVVLSNMLNIARTFIWSCDSRDNWLYFPRISIKSSFGQVWIWLFFVAFHCAFDKHLRIKINDKNFEWRFDDSLNNALFTNSNVICVMWIMLVILADTFSNALLNTSTQLLENTCVILTIRRTKTSLNNSLYWRNVVGNLNAWSTKCFLSRKRNPNWTLNQTQ